MKTAAQTTFAERLGRALGRAWRGCARLDRQAQGWLRAQGLALGAARAVSLVVKLVALAVLLYSAFWLALLLTLAVAAGAWAARSHEETGDKEWALGGQADHKQSVFYDPINYDDDPDPRFHDDR
ncbi:MAG: DUF3742 family protein [Brachymonas sp.]